MYRHILIPTDGSALSGMALEHGMALAASTKAKVTVLTVSPPFNAVAGVPGLTANAAEYKERAARQAASYLAVAHGSAAAANVPCDGLHVEHDHPYRAIIDTAASRGCDVIVMASHSRGGMAAIVLGSETVKVLTHSAIPVIVFRGQRPADFFAAS
jgi:nucleotide-binding universal stress UspA family protein